jgi:hypothetical protein
MGRIKVLLSFCFIMKIQLISQNVQGLNASLAPVRIRNFYSPYLRGLEVLCFQEHKLREKKLEELGFKPLLRVFKATLHRLLYATPSSGPASGCTGRVLSHYSYILQVRVRYALGAAVVACFHWLVGVGNGSSHLIACSNESFVCDTKPGWISMAGLTHDFPLGKCYHYFYTRSGGLRFGDRPIFLVVRHRLDIITRMERKELEKVVWAYSLTQK